MPGTEPQFHTLYRTRSGNPDCGKNSRQAHWRRSAEHDQGIIDRDGRIGRTTLNRPEKMNAIDADPGVHVIILSGKGKASCGGHDLGAHAESAGPNSVFQGPNRDPMHDFNFMWNNTRQFMSLGCCLKPVLCKVHGFAVGGGSDIALCADMVCMAETRRSDTCPPASGDARRPRCGSTASGLSGP